MSRELLPEVSPQPQSAFVDVAGHQLRLFEETPPLIAAMVRDIRAARKRVWLESYIILDDRAGRAVAAALKERAGAGVDVCVIYDAVGSFSTPVSYFEDLRAAGVKVHCYHSFWYSLSRGLFEVFNRRDHRKILVADDVVYFGGMNIVDQSDIHSVEDAEARHLPASAGWRDVHVRMLGPKTGEVADVFERLWRRVHRQRQRKRAPRWPGKRFLDGTNEKILFFESRPRLRGGRPQRVFLPLIRSARHSITLSMAYFLPIGRMLRELARAARRGVRVQVILPQQSDVRTAEMATRHIYKYLLKHGIEIYERKDQMLHSKVMIVDDLWSVIGSCNLDPRSLWINLEFLGIFRSRPLAEAVHKICRYEIEHSDQVCAQDLERRGRLERIWGWLAWRFLRRWL